MKLTILTVNPTFFDSFTQNQVIARAIRLNLLDFSVKDIREFTPRSFRAIDDSPYGGGKGMILRVDAVSNALEATKTANSHIVLLSPKGKTFNQNKAKELSHIEDLILLCGHYEGFDSRIDELADEVLSLGDFILTGGECAAQTVADAVIRLLPNVMKEDVTTKESFEENLLEYRQYTHPLTFKGNTVPQILLSGNDIEISNWKTKDSIIQTIKFRPDLLDKIKSLPIGHSNSKVIPIGNFFLKISEYNEESRQEIEMTKWAQNILPTCKLEYSETKDNKVYMLTHKANGRMLCDKYYFDRPELLLIEAVNSLKILWNTEISNCPFKCMPENLLNKVKDKNNPLYKELKATIPSIDRQVLSHGDLSLPNIFAGKKGIESFIDLGNCGIGDIWNDIAILLRSLKFNAAGIYNNGIKQFDFNQNRFFELLEIEPNLEKINWYTTLYELS